MSGQRHRECALSNTLHPPGSPFSFPVDSFRSASWEPSKHVIGPRDAEAESMACIADAEYLALFPSVLDDAPILAGRNLKLIQLVSAGFVRINV